VSFAPGDAAATAHAHSARLYTGNASDLTGFDHFIEVVAV
jgi:hypothetical protein